MKKKCLEPGRCNLPKFVKRSVVIFMFTLLYLSSFIGYATAPPAATNLNSVSAQDKIQIIVETDLGGDKDDQASLIRFLLYSNEFDIKGIILSRSNSQFQNDGNAANPSKSTGTLDMAYDYIDAYGQCLTNLRVHDPDFPSVSYLKGVTVYGHADGANAGKNHIINVLKNTTGTIWYTNWGANDGSQSSLDKALDAIKSNQVVGLNYNDVINRLCYVEVYKQNHIGDHRTKVKFYMDTFFPDMDGGKWYHRWGPLTGIASWLSANATKTFTKTYYTGQKEGDTPTWMHLIPNGMNVPGKPEWGSWSGRYGWNTNEFTGWWCNQRDNYKGTNNRDNTLLRWSTSSNATKSEHIANDFMARVLWAENSTFGAANHEPRPMVNGQAGTNVLNITLSAGSSISLDASGSTDPDGNTLSYKWDYYKEVSNYDNLILSSVSGTSITVTAPSDFTSGKEAHIILHVTDNGSPALTRYKRVIISGGTVPTNYTLTVTNSSNGSVTKSPDKTTYTSGEQLTLTAIPNSGYTFAGWSGDASGSTNPLSITVNQNLSITASFSPIQNSDLISNLTISNGKPYVWVDMINGQNMYIDRTYTFTSVPATLLGQKLLLTANDDKKSGNSLPLVSFKVNKDAIVYVLYTTVSTTLSSSWLTAAYGWTDEPYTVSSNLPGSEATRYIRSKAFTAGSLVELKGNGSTSGTSSMYNVVVAEATTKSDHLQPSKTDITNDIIVYPVPVKDEVWVKAASGIKSIRITSLSGFAFLTESPNESETIINLSHLAPGFYMLTVHTDDDCIIRKTIIKQ